MKSKLFINELMFEVMIVSFPHDINITLCVQSLEIKIVSVFQYLILSY